MDVAFSRDERGSHGRAKSCGPDPPALGSSFAGGDPAGRRRL